MLILTVLQDPIAVFAAILSFDERWGWFYLNIILNKILNYFHMSVLLDIWK